jgi:hypothetical protein
VVVDVVCVVRVNVLEVDGEKVGSKLGSNVGAPVGIPVGEIVGLKDGATVGCEDGEKVGCSVIVVAEVVSVLVIVDVMVLVSVVDGDVFSHANVPCKNSAIMRFKCPTKLVHIVGSLPTDKNPANRHCNA